MENTVENAKEFLTMSGVGNHSLPIPRSLLGIYGSTTMPELLVGYFKYVNPKQDVAVDVGLLECLRFMSLDYTDKEINAVVKEKLIKILEGI
jgi:hypothetical protein